MTTNATDKIRIQAQAGRQELFLSSPADIAIFGGKAFTGKTYAMLLECLRHVNVKGFSAVILRRTYPEIIKPGGLWDTSAEVYPMLGGEPNLQRHEWTFRGKSKIGFSTLQYEHSIHEWDGSQVPLICFDQLEQFTWKQFSYLFKANRSTCGINPYMRATCNPDPDCWLRRFLDWWIDDETGLAIEERAGVIRWYSVVNDEVIWGDSAEAVKAETGQDPKSATFIPGHLDENKIGLDSNPAYVANLQAMTRVDRERLLLGNWNVRPTAGMFFKRSMFEIIDTGPMDLIDDIRYWDLAATAPHPGNQDPDWTVGCRIGKDAQGFIILDVVRDRLNPFGVERLLKNTTAQDQTEKQVPCFIERDPAQAGKWQGQYLVRELAPHPVRLVPTTKGNATLTMAKGLSSQAEAGNVRLVRGKWNDAFLRELEGYSGDPKDAAHDDQVRTASGGLTQIANAVKWAPIRPSNGKRHNGNGKVFFGRNGERVAEERTTENMGP